MGKVECEKLGSRRAGGAVQKSQKRTSDAPQLLRRCQCGWRQEEKSMEMSQNDRKSCGINFLRCKN
jgi:hypothetical protein